MSTTPPTINSDWTDQPPSPPKSGMSSGAKVLLGLGLGCGVLMLLCCGGFIGFSVYMQKYLQKAISEDPAVVREVAQQIVQIDLPKGLEPTFSMDMKIPFMDQPLTRWAVYADQSTQSMFTLAWLAGMMNQQQQTQIQNQIDQSLRDQGVKGNQQLSNRESHQKTIQVKGQPVTFTFATGQDQNKKKRLEVTGSFPSQGGTVMLLASLDAEKYSEEQIVKTLESIK